MEEAADNVFMKSAWVKMNKILKYIDKQQDDDVFDVKEFTAKQFELSENRFARLLAMLKDDGYISGLDVIDHGEPDDFDGDDYQRFTIKITNPVLTIQGMRFLAENAALSRFYRAAKSIKDIVT